MRGSRPGGRSCRNRPEIARPSARPASCFVAAPMTLPMSAGEEAPRAAIISLSLASSSSSPSCFGRYSSSTAASASSFSASSGLPAALYCSADSLRCLASFIMSFITSASSRLSFAPSDVLASSIADFMERTAFSLTWSWAFIAAMMSFWICSSSFILLLFCISLFSDVARSGES